MRARSAPFLVGVYASLASACMWLYNDFASVSFAQTEGDNLVCDYDHTASSNWSILVPSGSWCTYSTGQFEYNPVYICDWVWLYGEPCAETLRSNGTTYSQSELSPVRTWISFAGCMGGCAGLGVGCGACVIAALAGGIPTGGIATAILTTACGSACAGAAVACFNSEQDCCGMHCEIAGIGTPSTTKHYSCN